MYGLRSRCSSTRGGLAPMVSIFAFRLLRLCPSFSMYDRYPADSWGESGRGFEFVLSTALFGEE
jgi:hypothetical protein